MAEQPGTLGALASAVGTALTALEGLLTAPNITVLLAELGLDTPPELAADVAFVANLTQAADAAGALEDALAALGAAPSGSPEELHALTALLQDLGHVVDALQVVADDFRRATAAAPDADELAQFALTFVERLIGSAVVDLLEVQHPMLRRILSLFTVVELQTVTVTVDQAPVPVVRRLLHLDRLGRLLSDPLSVLSDGYHWGQSDFDGKQLMSAVRDLFDVLMPVAVGHEEDQDGPQDLDFADILVRATTGVSPPGLEASILTSAQGPLNLTLADLSDTLRWALQVQGNLAAGLALLLLPPARLETLASADVAGSVRIGVTAQSGDPAAPVLLLGQAGGSRLQAVTASAGLVADLVWDAASGKAASDVGFEVVVTQGHLVVDLAGADGFLSAVLPAGGMTASIDFGLGWSPATGLTFRGGSGLSATYPVNLALGPLQLPTVRLRVAVLPGDAGSLQATGSVSVGLTIGPVAVVVDGIGLSVTATFPPSGGNLGIADVRVGFLAPDGLGMSIQASGLSGGGFVARDPSTGRYLGELQLKLGTVDITAVAILDSQLPGGRPGYDLLLALRATFPAVEIGLGFALTGVGGLVALNRRIDVDALRARLAAGTAGRILTPQDPIRNAPALLADLDTVFPPAPGITVIGPTVQVLWAGLVHFDVGVFVELPGPARIVLLGSAYASIARDGRTYLSVRVDVVGVVDLHAETAAFDAVLVDSHLLGILDLTGGAAFRLSWGQQPYSVLSLGGFNPAYDPAPLTFPATLARIAMVHGKPSDEVYLRFEGYFAVTSNTLQFGAAIDARLNAGGFSIHGTLSFDALIQFMPFHFEVDIRASVDVEYHGHSLAGLTLTGSLTGPGPVLLYGKVCIELLFFDICFDHTFTLGSTTPPPLPDTGDLLAALTAELDDASRLHSSGAPDPHVRLRAPDRAATSATTPVRPTDQLVWEQQRAPLDVLLTRLSGTRLPAPVQVQATSSAAGTATVADWFAPGQFTDLTDDQALTRPAFEQLTSGLSVFGEDSLGPRLAYTVTVKQMRLPSPTPIRLPGHVFPPWLVSAPAPAAAKVTLRPEQWSLHPADGTTTTGLSATAARQWAHFTPQARAVPSTDVLASFPM